MSSGIERFDLNTGQFTTSHFNGDDFAFLEFVDGRGVSPNALNSQFKSSVYLLATAPDVEPNAFIAMDIIEVSHFGSPAYVSCNPGIYKDGDNCLFFDIGVKELGGTNIFSGQATKIIGGSKGAFGLSFGPIELIAPFRFASVLDGNEFVGLVRQGGLWFELLRVDASPYLDLTDPDALVGWKPGFSHWSPSFCSSTVTVDNLEYGPNTDIFNPPEFFPFYAPINLTLDENEADHVKFHWNPSEERI